MRMNGNIFRSLPGHYRNNLNLSSIWCICKHKQICMYIYHELYMSSLRWKDQVQSCVVRKIAWMFIWCSSRLRQFPFNKLSSIMSLEIGPHDSSPLIYLSGSDLQVSTRLVQEQASVMAALKLTVPRRLHILIYRWRIHPTWGQGRNLKLWNYCHL